MAVLFLILKVGIFSIEWKNSIPNLACYQPKSRPYPIPILPKSAQLYRISANEQNS